MPLQIIHVGLGGWGLNWFENVVSKNKNIETTAWVEIDENTLQAVQKRLDLPAERCFTSLEQALETVSADAVLVTASLPGHVPSARAALQAGKHVLMEKPFAPTVEEARELVELAEKQNRLLMISQNYRFYPAARTVAQLIQEQIIGRLGDIHIDFRRYDNIKPFVESRHYSIWEPLLVDMAIHHFDLMRLVIGQEPVEVFCKTWNSAWSKYKEPAAGSMTITFDGGAVVNYRGNWASTAPQTNWAGEWHMEGEKGLVSWTSRGELPDAVSLQLQGEEKQPVKLLDVPSQDREGSLEAFIEAVRSNHEPETSGRRNLKTLALMFAAVESARQGGVPVKVV